jgi:DNA-binding transcriptional LysR family regulator
MTTSFDFARDQLAGWLPEFHARHPAVTLDIELTQRAVDLVAEGFDLAVRGGGRVDSPGVVRKLAGSDVILCASQAYLKKRGTPRTLDELARHKLVAMPGIFAGGKLRLVGPAGPVELACDPWLVINEWGVLREVVTAGLGVGLLESGSCSEQLRRGELRRVLPEYGLPGGGLFALYPTGRHLSPTVRVFIDFLVEKLSATRGARSGSRRASRAPSE